MGFPAMSGSPSIKYIAELIKHEELYFSVSLIGYLFNIIVGNEE